MRGGPGADICDGGEGDRDANQGELPFPEIDDCEAEFGFP